MKFTKCIKETLSFSVKLRHYVKWRKKLLVDLLHLFFKSCGDLYPHRVDPWVKFSLILEIMLVVTEAYLVHEIGS